MNGETRMNGAGVSGVTISATPTALTPRRGRAVHGRVRSVDASAGDCIPWRGRLTRMGYGIGYDPATQHQKLATRLLWERIRGPIPKGLTLDHLCHDSLVCPGGPGDPHRACVNLDHLTVATRGANALRGNSAPAKHARMLSCVHGHEFRDPRPRSHTDPRIRRSCPTCDALSHRRRRERAGLVRTGLPLLTGHFDGKACVYGTHHPLPTGHCLYCGKVQSGTVLSRHAELVRQ